MKYISSICLCFILILFVQGCMPKELPYEPINTTTEPVILQATIQEQIANISYIGTFQGNNPRVSPCINIVEGCSAKYKASYNASNEEYLIFVVTVVEHSEEIKNEIMRQQYEKELLNNQQTFLKKTTQGVLSGASWYSNTTFIEIQTEFYNVPIGIELDTKQHYDFSQIAKAYVQKYPSTI